jgi:hypothetical protein
MQSVVDRNVVMRRINCIYIKKFQSYEIIRIRQRCYEGNPAGRKLLLERYSFPNYDAASVLLSPAGRARLRTGRSLRDAALARR